MYFRIFNKIRYAFTILNKQLYTQLKTKYLEHSNAQLLKPYLRIQNVSLIYYLLQNGKKIGIQSFISTLSTLDVLINQSSQQTENHNIPLKVSIKKSLARAYLQYRQFNKSVQVAEDAIALLNKMQNPDHEELVELYIIISENKLIDINKQDQAYKLLLKTVQILEQNKQKFLGVIQSEQKLSLVYEYLASTYAKISYYYLSKNKIGNAKQYIDLSLQQWKKTTQITQYKNYEFSVRTKCIIYKALNKTQQVVNDCKQCIDASKIIENKIWLLNFLVKSGSKQFNDQLQNALFKLRGQIPAHKYNSFLKRLQIVSQ